MAALLPAVAKRMTGAHAPGVWAAALLVALPLIPAAPQLETSLLLAALLAYYAWDGGATARGAAAGAIFHISPTALLILGPAEQRSRLLPWLAAAALVCVPWTLRNFALLGGASFIRNNLPLELRLSNHDSAQPVMLAHRKLLLDAHPQYSRTEAQRVVDLGETAYQRANLREFRQWIQANPARFTQLTLQRMGLFWFPESPHGWPHRASLAAVTILSLFSLKRWPIAWLWILALYPLPFYVIQADARYRYPVLWISLLGAGLSLEWLRQAWIQRAQVRRGAAG
jgi:hypothetical protein